MENFDELLEQVVTCEGCGLARCQCHRVKSISRDVAGRPAMVVFFADKGQTEEVRSAEQATVQGAPAWVVWCLLSSFLFWVVCLTAKVMGWL